MDPPHQLMKKIFFAFLHELEHVKKKVQKLEKFCPDPPPPFKKILNFFFSNEPFPYVH